jgi:hypothetical protein
MLSMSTADTTYRGTDPRKERLMASTSITVSPIAASDAGALAGHEARCTCGTVLTTSLSEREARNLAHQHAAWHARKGS